MREKICCFTGHRELPKQDRKRIGHKLEQTIVCLIERGVKFYGAGGALGFDTIAVLALRERNRAVKLHCVLPCEGQEIMWTVPVQVRYKYILGEADSVEYVKRLYDGKCMLERNQRLVDSAGILLAVYNGEKRGGTAATVRYALKAERKIIYSKRH